MRFLILGLIFWNSLVFRRNKSSSCWQGRQYFWPQSALIMKTSNLGRPKYIHWIMLKRYLLILFVWTGQSVFSKCYSLLLSWDSKSELPVRETFTGTETDGGVPLTRGFCRQRIDFTILLTVYPGPSTRIIWVAKTLGETSFIDIL